MLDKISKHLGLKSKRSIVETESMLRNDLYDAGYTVAIFAYLIYTSNRIKRARKN